MLRKRSEFILSVSVLAVLAACTGASPSPQNMAPPIEAAAVQGNAVRVSNPTNLNPLRMMVGANGMQEINAASKAEIRMALRTLDPADCGDGAAYKECLRRLRDKPGKFQGVSGLTGRAFARAAQSLENQGDGSRPTVDVRGQILQRCLHDPTKPGYELTRKVNGDPSALSLCVYMETTVENPGNGGTDPRVRYQYFHIEAEENVGIDDGSGGTPGNGWPTAAMRTGLTIPQKPGFNNKLYAWGEKIRVETYWEATRLKGGAPDWDKYDSPPQGKPRIQAFFDPDPNACVDMLFELPVPDTLPVGYTGGVDYCLGRCKNPPIVNTR